jgi:hypothetical protein
MGISVTIRNDELPPSARRVQVTVVTVGNTDANEQLQLLGPQEGTTVQVYPGQFVMVDEKEGA